MSSEDDQDNDGWSDPDPLGAAEQEIFLLRQQLREAQTALDAERAHLADWRKREDEAVAECGLSAPDYCFEEAIGITQAERNNARQRADLAETQLAEAQAQIASLCDRIENNVDLQKAEDKIEELQEKLAQAEAAHQGIQGVLSKTRALLPHFMPATQRNEVFGAALLEIEKLVASRPQEPKPTD